MATAEPGSETEERVCYRCDDPIGDAHEICLTVVHQGVHADRYSGVNRQICPDCPAAIGLLEFEVDEIGDQQGVGTPWWDRVTTS